MFENLKNIGAMLGQARQMREKLEQLQAELAKRTVEGNAGAGAVRVTVNGKFEVLAVRLDRPLLAALLAPAGGEEAADADADHAMVEELIAAAANDALAQARQLVQEEVSRMTGGLSLPGM